MLQYVIRRLLYSILVLVLASFLTFTFVAKTGDPLAPLRITPNVSPETIANVTERKHLDESLFVRYGYWVEDALTNQFGTTLLGEKKILDRSAEWAANIHTRPRRPALQAIVKCCLERLAV